VSGRRPGWDFGYAPVTPAARAPEPSRDLVVATPTAVDPSRVAAAASARAVTLLARAPLFWTRLLLEQPDLPARVADRLAAAGVALRYVASASQPSLAFAPPLDLASAPLAVPRRWPARAVATHGPFAPVDDAPGSWFLREGEGGVAVPREGGGLGTRLAVIDDDALGVDELALDAEVPVEIDRVPRHQLHGALVVAWASGSRRFAGVAPGASARLYVIPKPGVDVVALPLALARAALDGADVIVCATYVEGAASPMLDDALELATRLGRRGRGAAVVLPTGRETSSAAGSVHGSFSLGLGEPASDPRVFCVGPGARGGGWFLWRDRRGRLHPFANRGPAVRWLAPGDDVAYPFTPEGSPPRLFHAESSGAAAVAAGVLLLVLGENPSLRRSELGAVVDATLSPVAPEVAATPDPLADAADALPPGRDRDGHNAKHGLGLLHAGRACLFAADPICAALVGMGEDGAARAWADLRRNDPEARDAYSRDLGRWAVRVVLRDPEVLHALRAILRHLRLVAGDEARGTAHGEGALVRSIGLWLRRLATARPATTASVRAEARALATRCEVLVTAGAFEAAVTGIAARCFDRTAP
jgi:hypothetical protein